MRLNGDHRFTGHGLLTGVGEDDHHLRGISRTIIVNSQAVAAYTAFQHLTALGATGFRTFRAILRGTSTGAAGGHDGCFVIAGNASQQCSAVGIRLNPSAAQSYAGAYSRIFGDVYLATYMFGSAVVLRDAFISGSNAVLEFYNPSPMSQSFTCYGTMVIK
jgi:hypothetical protein